MCYNKEEKEPLLNLGNLLETLYKQYRYDLRIDYSVNPVPALDHKDQAWLEATLR